VRGVKFNGVDESDIVRKVRRSCATPAHVAPTTPSTHRPLIVRGKGGPLTTVGVDESTGATPSIIGGLMDHMCRSRVPSGTSVQRTNGYFLNKSTTLCPTEVLFASGQTYMRTHHMRTHQVPGVSYLRILDRRTRLTAHSPRAAGQAHWQPGPPTRILRQPGSGGQYIRGNKVTRTRFLEPD
jgi:hypothetical protein